MQTVIEINHDMMVTLQDNLPMKMTKKLLTFKSFIVTGGYTLFCVIYKIMSQGKIV